MCEFKRGQNNRTSEPKGPISLTFPERIFEMLSFSKLTKLELIIILQDSSLGTVRLRRAATRARLRFPKRTDLRKGRGPWRRRQEPRRAVRWAELMERRRRRRLQVLQQQRLRVQEPQGPQRLRHRWAFPGRRLHQQQPELLRDGPQNPKAAAVTTTREWDRGEEGKKKKNSRWLCNAAKMSSSKREATGTGTKN